MNAQSHGSLATLPPPVVPAGVIPFDQEAWLRQREQLRPKSKTQAKAQRGKRNNNRDRQLVQNATKELARLTAVLEAVLNKDKVDPEDRFSLTTLAERMYARKAAAAIERDVKPCPN